MNGFCSLKQVERVRCEVGDKLQPAPIFGGAVVSGGYDALKGDAESGKLTLAPGSYFVAFTAHLLWQFVPRITVALIVGGDERFRGPRATAEAEVGALELFDSVQDVARYVQIQRPDWKRRFTRSVSTFGTIIIPEGPAVPVGIWASATVERHDPVTVTFSGAELIAIRLTQMCDQTWRPMGSIS